MVEYFSSYTTILPSLVTIGLAEEEIILIGHVTSHDQVANGLCGIMGVCLSF